MEEVPNHLSHLFETLGQDQFQQILGQFSIIIPFPLFVINPEGEILVEYGMANLPQPFSPQFAVDPIENHVTWQIEDKSSPYTRICSAAMMAQGDAMGYVVMCGRPDRNSDEEYLGRLRLVATYFEEKAFAEFELGNLTEELIEKYNEVNLIYDISEALGAVLDSVTVCHVLIEKAVGVIGVEKASIMLYDETSDRLFIAASHGFDISEEEQRKILIVPGERISGKVFLNGKPMIVENVEDPLLPDVPYDEHERYDMFSVAADNPKYKKKSFLSVPMICRPKHAEKKMGVINMTDKLSSDMFTAGDVRLLSSVAAQAAMSLYNIQLIEQVRDAERVKQEMSIAQDIQRKLLPATPPFLPGIDLAGRCLPATQVGGDYYDFFLNANNKLGVVIADVSGHNVGAALMMAIARSTLRSEAFTQKSPAQILQNTNLILYEDLTNAQLFITMFYAEYDSNTRMLRYSNGGHNHPIVLRQGVCTFLNAEGMLIGMLDFVDFEEKTMFLQKNDLVIFYTDGVVEAKNVQDEMLGIDRLCREIELNWQCNAQEMIEKIYDMVEQYSENTFRSDDITVVVLKIC